MQPRKIPKIEVRSEIILHNGSALVGHIFVPANTRVSDVLDDGRSFLPFVDDKGRVLLLNKRFIVHVRPLE